MGDAAPKKARDPFATVSIEELAAEIAKHSTSEHLGPLLTELRSKAIGLKEFCRRVRMLDGPDMGPHVLMKTVAGLQRRQQQARLLEEQKAREVQAAQQQPQQSPQQPPSAQGAAAAASTPALAASSAVDTAAAAALAAPAAVQLPTPSSAHSATMPSPASEQNYGRKVLIHALLCPKLECDVQGCCLMKKLLKKLEHHARGCSISNLPAGQSDCTTCNKWHTMLQLRESYVSRSRFTYDLGGFYL